MGAVRAGEQQAPMQSLVNWALLGLVIERSSYAYELAQRFERTYEGVLSLSSISHVYTALGTLRERSLVEEVPGTRSGRQPKPHYRASEQGVAEYRSWLVGQIDDERRRQRLSIVQLAALGRHPEQALEVIALYEQACLEEARETPLAERNDASGDGAAALIARLAGEGDRLAVGAKLAWVQYARGEFKALASGRARR
jgi:DNA-binding PadR family transcriptional regulator